MDLSSARISFYVGGILQNREKWPENREKLLKTLEINEKKRHNEVQIIFNHIDSLIEECKRYRKIVLESSDKGD